MNQKTYAVDHIPGIWGGVAVVKGSAIPVFLMEGLYRCRFRTEDVTEAYPWLTLADVRSALDYADEHREEIDADRARQREAWESLRAGTGEAL